MKLIIRSGGQTGVDRAALEVAKTYGCVTGGWVPKGWLTENGPDPSLADFGCKEHKSAKYPPRTYANVHDSDGTLWIGVADMAGYTCTYNATQNLEKPWKSLVIGEDFSTESIVAWILENDIKELNVAGPRGSRFPEAKSVVSTVLLPVFEMLEKVDGTHV